MSFTGNDRTRFLSKVSVDQNTECWVWQAAKNVFGYGNFWLGGRKERAHRAGYMLFVGPVPDGLVLDHVCRNRACVNPDHLEPKTQRDNLLAPGSLASAKALAERTHCPSGHVLEMPNLSPSLLRRGRRGCLACARARSTVHNNKIRHGIVVDFQAEADRHYAEIMAAPAEAA